MAWISVHEQVIGGKLRELAKEIGCSQNEALGLLVRLWLWGINNADKEGKIIGAEKVDIADVLNVGIDKRYQPENVVDALVETRWIDLEENGLFIHDWEEWQKQWYKALDVRARDAERKRKERNKNKIVGNDEVPKEPEKGQEAVQNTPNPIIPPADEVKKQSTVPAYTKEFEDFWGIYPRKLGKGEAYKKYKARINDGWSPDELKQAAGNYAAVCLRKRTDKEYIKHAKTFLSDNTPFTDYLPKKDEIQKVSGSNDDSDPYADWRR